jgi:tol-pal system protein YbgF
MVRLILIRRFAAPVMLGLMAVSLMASAPATAKGRAELTKRVYDLELEVYQLKKSLAAKPAAPPPAARAAAAQIEVRLMELEATLRGLTGQLEETRHRLDTIESRLGKLAQDVEFRLSALEHGGVASPQPPVPKAAPEAAEKTPAPVSPPTADTTPPAQSPALPPALPEGTVQEQYDFASALLRRNDYEAAERAFAAFLKQHPDDALASNAQYWLGETFYVRGRFDEAAEAFLTGYEKFSGGKKGPASLLKLGMSLMKLGKKDHACAAWRQLGQRYPDAPARVLARAKAERRAANCP